MRPDALLTEIRTVRAEIQQALRTMLDPRDVPGAWTLRHKEACEEGRHRLHQHVQWAATLTESLEKDDATRAT